MSRPAEASNPQSAQHATSGPLRMLPAAEVLDLLAVTHAPERIEEYRQAIGRGVQLPPIAVVNVLGRWVVADGHKRLSARLSLGETEVLAEVWPPRRLLADQWRQLVAKSRQQVRIAMRSPFDPAARREAYRLFWDTVLHWRRIVLSVARLRG